MQGKTRSRWGELKKVSGLSIARFLLRNSMICGLLTCDSLPVMVPSEGK
jgi:hypothetical protein